MAVVLERKEKVVDIEVEKVCLVLVKDLTKKKTLVIKLYGNAYFGKQGITSRGTVRDTRQRINLYDVEQRLEKYGQKKRRYLGN